jgi:hypothetical protein
VGVGLQLPQLTEIRGHPVAVRLMGVAIAPGTRVDNMKLAGAGAPTFGARFDGQIDVGLVRRRSGELRMTLAYAYEFLTTRYPRNSEATSLEASQHGFTAGLAYAY